MKKIIISYIFFISLLNSGFAQNISVEASISTTSTAVNEQIQYSIIINGAQNVAKPQLPSIPNFQVHDIGTSSSVQIINNQMSVSKSFNYILVPTAEGTFTIPSVAITHNGQTYQTRSFTVTITKQSQPAQNQKSPTIQERFFRQTREGELFVKTFINKNEAYVDEPVMYSHKVYIRNLAVNDYGQNKYTDFSGFWVEDIPPDQYNKVLTEKYQDKSYKTKVLEKKVLFPASPGQKNIKAAEFIFSVNDGFSFFNRRVQRSSEPVAISVKPLPELGRPPDFKGAVGSYSISSTIPKKKITQNEPFNLKIIISGSGNIKSISEPAMPQLQNFRLYDTISSVSIQKHSSGVSGSKVYEYILIPESSGKLEIPEFTFSYFDYIQKRYRTLRSKKISINVNPGQPGSSTDYTKYAVHQSDVTLIGKDINFIKEDEARSTNSDYFFNYPVFWILILLPLLILGVGFYHYQYKLKLESDITFAKFSKAYKTAKRTLLQIEKNIKTESYEEISSLFEKMLATYISYKFNIPISSIVIDQIKKILNKKNLDTRIINDIEEIYHEINMLKYSPVKASTMTYNKLLVRSNELINKIEKSI